MTTIKKKRASKRGQSTAEKKNAGLRIIPLGGLGEIGKNITAIEYGDEIVVIDCGMKFPEEEMLGIDFVVPDVQYLVDNKEKIRGIFLTHGHEDHIGAIPLVLPRLDAPLYGTALTLALVENKMLDASVSYKPNYNQITAGDAVKVGQFEAGFIRVSHSIPDSLAIWVRTPVGTIVHSGDFKLDATPIGGQGTDLGALAEIGKEGVLLLMSDSTNSERPGFTPSESVVTKSFEDIFRSHKDRRIVIAAFASNLYRAQQVFATASRFNRKVVLMGRSMLSYVELARRLGYVDVPDELLISPTDADKLSPNRVVVLTTGSQGEPFSGLVLMSKGEHRQIRLGPRDLVVISATPIPGNEKLVSKTVNRLFACGCDVIYERGSNIHVSGHASREEQKILLSLVKPKFFMPVHGEYRHLVRHGQLAREMGIPAKNVFVMQNGDTLCFGQDGRAATGDKIHSGAVLVDGMMLGEFEGSLLRERKELSESGLLTLSIVIDADLKLLAPIQIESKGSVFGLDRENMSPDIELAAAKALEALRAGSIDRSSLLTEIRKKIREVVSRNFRAYPTIVPMVTTVGEIAKKSDAQPAAAKPKARRRARGPRKGSQPQL
ncbi:MAG: ribonuclease J [Synergistaceae bacterium]|jgi:ribonuclease J|nr:ribonuclease J [Synergistaceae bacterium]